MKKCSRSNQCLYEVLYLYSWYRLKKYSRDNFLGTMSFSRFCFPVFLAQPKYNLSIISISSFKRPYQSHLVWSSLLLLPVSLLLSSSASVVHEESSTSLNHHQNEKGVPGLMQCRYVVFLCRDMRKGIYVRRSASQNSFLARAFALQSNVNWLQTQLADWVRTHTHADGLHTHQLAMR